MKFIKMNKVFMKTSSFERKALKAVPLVIGNWIESWIWYNSHNLPIQTFL